MPDTPQTAETNLDPASPYAREAHLRTGEEVIVVGQAFHGFLHPIAA